MKIIFYVEDEDGKIVIGKHKIGIPIGIDPSKELTVDLLARDHIDDTRDALSREDGLSASLSISRETLVNEAMMSVALTLQRFVRHNLREWARDKVRG